MAGFTTTYENQEAILPGGIYEVVCTGCYETATKGGTLYIQLRLMVRDDVPQDAQRAVHYEAMFKKKEPDKDDKAVGGYSFKRIMQISEAFGIPKGTSFATLDDWCTALRDRCAQATIEHDSYGGRTRARVKWFNKSEKPPYQKPEEPAALDIDTDFEEFDGDDLPF